MSISADSLKELIIAEADDSCAVAASAATNAKEEKRLQDFSEKSFSQSGEKSVEEKSAPEVVSEPVAAQAQEEEEESWQPVKGKKKKGGRGTVAPPISHPSSMVGS